MNTRLLIASIGLWIGTWACGPARAAVVVLENRTSGKVELAVRQADETQSRHVLAAGDVLPIPAPGPVGVAFDAQGETRAYMIEPNSIHCFMVRDKKLDLYRLPLPKIERAAGKEKPGPSKPPAAQAVPDSPLIIPVAVFHNDSEPLVRELWEKRIRKRLDDASDIFEHHCRVRFKIVSVGTWTADKAIFEFHKSLLEFQRKVQPWPARLAIGFTSQYQWLPGEKHLGGTYGPLHSHILVREGLRNVSDPERLEVLVHELGHYLGAVHTPDQNSVMRPTLGDRRARLRGFRIGFDAPNTMAMFLLAEEIRRQPVAGLFQFSPETKAPLRGVYAMLAEAMPQDTAAKKYLALLDLPPRLAAQPPERLHGMLADARSVVQAVVQAAQRNQQLPERTAGGAQGPHRLSGDELAECYVRAAATAAKGLPRSTAPQAFLLGLAVALDDSSVLRNAPLTGFVWQLIEPDEERETRLAVLGQPTFRGRHDLGQHFAVSAALVVIVGEQAAELAGIAKEVSDANGGSGFSFQDLLADLAGVAFGVAVRDGKVAPASLAESFKIQDFLPEPTGLKEGLAWPDFAAAYGGVTGEPFLREVQRIRQRIAALPGYKAATTRP